MIKINLNDLTEEKLAQALESKCAGSNACTYSAPCIIGTLIPSNSTVIKEYDSDFASVLLTSGILGAPQEQYEHISDLQFAFDQLKMDDADMVERFKAMVRVWIKDR